MSRLQLALNVSNLDAAIQFYSTLFATEPAKVRPGYANFAVAEPPLKLVLIEGAGRPGSLNHLGVEVSSTEEVAAATTRLAGEGLDCATEDNVSCCYAVQDKVWVDGPDREPWEIYTVLGDTESSGGGPGTVEADGEAACCATSPEAAPIACALSAEEASERAAAWADLLTHVGERQPTSAGVRLGLPPDPAVVARAADLAVREAECCAFFSFGMTIDATGARLDVAAPPDRRAAVTALFGAAEG